MIIDSIKLKALKRRKAHLEERVVNWNGADKGYTRAELSAISTVVALFEDEPDEKMIGGMGPWVKQVWISGFHAGRDPTICSYCKSLNKDCRPCKGTGRVNIKTEEL